MSLRWWLYAAKHSLIRSKVRPHIYTAYALSLAGALKTFLLFFYFLLSRSCHSGLFCSFSRLRPHSYIVCFEFSPGAFPLICSAHFGMLLARVSLRPSGNVSWKCTIRISNAALKFSEIFASICS